MSGRTRYERQASIGFVSRLITNCGVLKREDVKEVFGYFLSVVIFVLSIVLFFTVAIFPFDCGRGVFFGYFF